MRFSGLLLTPLLSFSVLYNSPSIAQKKGAAAETRAANAVQPAVESLDLDMYARIREEGFRHSHVMEYASALFDDIGPRLTGSENLKHANEWTRDQFTAMGCKNAHLEDWGDFGMGWKQLNTRVRMTSASPCSR